MQCPHCAHPDSIRYGTSRDVQRYRCQACRRIFQRYDEAKIQPSSNRPVSSISKGWGCEPSAGFSASITRQSLAGWYKLSKHSQQAHHRPKPAPSSKSMNSARSSLIKIPMLALASGGLHLWQGPWLCLWKKDDQNG